jgi:hypothetical protein
MAQTVRGKLWKIGVFIAIQLIVIGVPFVAIEALQPYRDHVVGSSVKMDFLTGAQAKAHMDAHHAKNAALVARRRQRMEALRLTAQVAEDRIIAIHREEIVQIERRPNGVVGAVMRVFTANAQGTISQHRNDADAYLTPFEDDGNGNTTEWNHENDTYMHGQYPDEELEIDTYANLRLDNSDPDNLPLLQTWDVVQPPLARGCPPGTDGVFAGLTGMFTMHAQGVATYYGIRCDDKVALAHEKLGRAARDANIAAGGAAIPCIGASIGWLSCVGGAWIGGFFVSGIQFEYGQWSACGYWPGWTPGHHI